MSKPARPATTLIEHLHALAHDHRVLSHLVRKTLKAMRASNVEEVEDALQSQADVIRRIRDREAQRKAAVEAIGRQLGLSSIRAKSIKVRHLAERLPEPDRSALLAAGEGLRKAMAELVMVNRTAGTAANRLVDHLHLAMQAGRLMHPATAGYGAAGCCALDLRDQLFETTG